MREEEYNYLRDYGLTKEEIRACSEENPELYEYSKELFQKNINFLEEYSLTKEQIITLIKKNPYILTTGSKKKELLNKIYSKYYTKEEIKDLLINYAYLYIVNPLELENVIEYLEDKGLNFKEEVSKNVDILSMNLDEIKEIL